MPRARVEFTRLGAWLVGIATLVILVGGVVTVGSLWNTTQDDLPGRIFIIVWLVLFVAFGLNNLRVCWRRSSTTVMPPGFRMDVRTPLVTVTPIDKP
ncbi:hypothetical protein [Kineosporia babensis]|uniref:Uncharacterized protein n=1 Tax=Kineosporia babensis TaxID=499548 RepID=A0A9X1NHW4_9ACTN|nr:hypothetical protein [Kineosporia babensis]MCD5315307.1 hypothetical protein [Kineosporia babensis]